MITALLCGCAASVAPVSGGGGDRADLSPAYLQALDRASREVEAYRRLDTRLLAHATLWTPAFRQAYLEEYAHTFRLSRDETATLEQQLEKDAAGRVQLTVWLSSAEPKLASLELRDKLWSLKLYDGQGRSAAPASITLVKRPSTVDQHFFPYINTFGRVYQLVFPNRPAGGEPFLSGSGVTLQFAGVLGVAEMHWDLAGGGAAVAAP